MLWFKSIFTYAHFQIKKKIERIFLSCFFPYSLSIYNIFFWTRYVVYLFYPSSFSRFHILFFTFNQIFPLYRYYFRLITKKIIKFTTTETLHGIKSMFFWIKKIKSMIFLCFFLAEFWGISLCFTNVV